MNITAVLVASNHVHLGETLLALSEQQRTPDRLIVVDARMPESSGELSEHIPQDLPEEIEWVDAKGHPNFGTAVSTALEKLDLDETEWLWFLHHDSPPEPRALAELTRATASARAVGVAGCKQVHLADPSRLISVGVRYTQAGRRLPGIEPGEIDQGQYDQREDMYAVGTAGMLIRRSTWENIGGIDPALGPFLDGAELCRRVRLQGERVIVVPEAIVRHGRTWLWHGPYGQAETRDGTHSFLDRRVETLHFRLVTASLWKLIFVALGIIFFGVGRSIWRVAANDVALATQELQAIAKVWRPHQIYRSRRNIAARATMSRRVLGPLQATRVDVWRTWWDRMRTARVARRRRHAPSELEIAEQRVITRRRRSGLTVLVFTLIGVSVYSIAAAFSTSVFDFPALVGGALGGLDQSYLELWDRALAGWSSTGDGFNIPAHPMTAVFAALATIVGGPIGVDAHAAINILLALALPLAGVSAWYGAGGFTRSVVLRLWAGLAWALAPVLALAVGHGRVEILLAHILLPLFALALLRTFGVNRRDSIRLGIKDAGEREKAGWVPVVAVPSGKPSSGAAAAAALCLAVITACAPLLFVPLGIITLIWVALVRPWRGWGLFVLVPTLVLFVPRIIYAARHGWHTLPGSLQQAPINLGEFAPSAENWWDLIPWFLPSGWVHDPHLIIAGVAAGFVALIGAIGLWRTGWSGKIVRTGWALIGLGVAVVVSGGFIFGEPQYDWLGSMQLLPQWGGPGVSLAYGGSVLTVIGALNGSRQMLRQREMGIAHGGLALGVIALVAVVTGAGIHSFNTFANDLQWHTRDVQPLPALARQTVRSDDRPRVLMLAPHESTLAAAVWRNNGPQMVDTRIITDDAARQDLEQISASLYAGVGEDVGERLRAHAIGFILVPDMSSPLVSMEGLSREELIASLDGLADLERVTQNDSGSLWRVTGQASRVWIEYDQEQIAMPAHQSRVVTQLPDLPTTAEATIVMAERNDPGWRATVGGTRLEPVEHEWHQAFTVPQELSGELRITYAPLWHRIWQFGVTAVFGFTLVLSLPVRSRPEVIG